MHKHLLTKLGCCLLLSAIYLYSYFNTQNDLTQMKIDLPQLEKKIRSIREETGRLRYEIDQFENPTHLIEIAHSPEYSHLKHPLLKEILTVSEGFVAQNQ